MIRAALLGLALLAAPALAQTQPLQSRVEAELAQAPQGTRFGLLVVDETGREVIAIDPDQRFIPGSNAKLFTTAAAFALFDPAPGLAEAQGATTVSLVPRTSGPPDAVLRGGGGVSLSSAPDCVIRCLAELARAIAARTRKVHDVIADPTPFAEPHWSPGMSWNNIGTVSGTAVSAAMVDDNTAAITVTPGAPGEPSRAELPAWFTLDNRALTVAEGPTALMLEREVNARRIVLRGSIAANSPPWRERLGIDDPSHHAAWALVRALREAGVRVEGAVRTDSPASSAPANFVIASGAKQPRAGPSNPGLLRSARNDEAQVAPLNVIATVPAVPLDEELARINKDSQNLHAEALLRRLGVVAFDSALCVTDESLSARGEVGVAVTRQCRTPTPDPSPPEGAASPGTREAGLAAMARALAPAGLPAAGVELHDGSGMSSYNRLSPRATVALLRWSAAQPWGERYRASLPVAGIDGTLRTRFTASPLAGRLFAKTGTLNASNALSGYLRTNSGQTWTFAFFANDVPAQASVTALMERVLVAVAGG